MVLNEITMLILIYWYISAWLEIYVYSMSVQLICVTWELRLGFCQLICMDSLSFCWNGVGSEYMILKQSLEQT